MRSVPTFEQFKLSFPMRDEDRVRQAFEALPDERKLQALFYLDRFVSFQRGRAFPQIDPLNYLLGGGWWMAVPAVHRKRLEAEAGLWAEESAPLVPKETESA